MSVIAAAARAALLLCPSEFRAQYGDQILSDIESDPRRASAELLDLIGSAMGMHVDGLLRDVVYALRRLRAAPLFVAIVVLTFALGIGANVGVFSVLNSVVLRPLPYLNPSGIVAIRSIDARKPMGHLLSIADVSDLQTQAKTLAQIAAVSGDGATYTGGAKPAALQGLDVMPDFFAILGVSAEVGRVLDANDTLAGVTSVMISDSIWRKYFAADPAAIGKTIVLDGVAHRIVGVTKPGQLFPDPATRNFAPVDYIEPFPKTMPANKRTLPYLGAVARIAPGQTLDSVNVELRLVSTRLEGLSPVDRAGISYDAIALSTSLLGDIASMLWVVFACVVGVLLIACANVANLLGARWWSRDREFALRRALGASWRTIGRQLLVETCILAFLGGIAGTLLASGALAVLRSTVLHVLPRGGDVSLDGTTLLYALYLVAATALIAGVSPIVMTRDKHLQRILKTAGPRAGGGSSARLRSILVAAEVALAFALVIVTGLMVRSFVSLTQTPLGVRTDGVLLTSITSLSEKTYTTLGARSAVQTELLRRLRALPGVDSAALTVLYPLGDAMLRFQTAVSGETYANGEEPETGSNSISPGYFRTMGIALLHGRDFSDRYSADAPPVAIVNQSFAQAFLRGREVLGTRIRVDGWNGTKTTWSTIVGVVADERTRLAMPVSPMIYSPIAQTPPSFFAAVVHGSANRATLANEITAAFAAAAPSSRAPDVFTMDERLAIATKEARLSAVLFGVLSAVALLLALAGIFGVMSFTVTQRMHEFGIRLAHGASTQSIIVDVLRRAAVTAAAGIALGVIIAAIGARAISTRLYDVSPLDPLTFGAVILLLFTCSCIAALQPALRATRVQVAVALRHE